MRRVSLAALVILAGCWSSWTPWTLNHADPRTVRRPPAGDVIGGAGRYGSFAWLGIPYAKPPVDALRWRAPEPLDHWGGTRRALEFGNACVQYGSRFGGAPNTAAGDVGGSEDCLVLNVWAPEAGGKGMPVFFWIHGGGNTIGHAGTYDGGNLAATHRMVVVTVNYRLGPFGWFRNAALDGGASAAERSGNFAVLDLVRALQWVRENIAAFGGNPQNVTIAGESAGGTNVYALLLSPEARGLFHRAIVQSGGLLSYTPAEAEHAVDDPEPGHALSSTETVLRLAEGRLAPDRAAAKAHVAGMKQSDLASWLRTLPAADVLAAYPAMPGGMIDMPRVIADGTVLPAGNLTASLGRPDGWNRVPVVAGTNLDEQKLFMALDPRYVRMRFWILPQIIDEPRYEVTAEYTSRAWKALGADVPAAAMARSEPRTFVYRFDWREEPTILGSDLAKLLGAAHAFEIPFVFGHFDLGPEAGRIYTEENAAGRKELSDAMMSYWAEFAYAGDPGRGRSNDLPAWEPWTDGGRWVVLDTSAAGGIRMDFGIETRASLLAAVDADARLAAPRDRCRVLHELVAARRLLTRDEYAQRCADFPYEGYPWDG